MADLRALTEVLAGGRVNPAGLIQARAERIPRRLGCRARTLPRGLDRSGRRGTRLAPAEPSDEQGAFGPNSWRCVGRGRATRWHYDRL